MSRIKRKSTQVRSEPAGRNRGKRGRAMQRGLVLVVLWWGGLSGAVVPTPTTTTNNNNINNNSSSVGQVRIRCQDNSIGLELDNADGLEGRLFARRMGQDPNCVRHYSQVPFNFLSCGIQSKRLMHPRPGIEYTMTVILSRDHAHMTEDDQMYTLTCRYFANHKDVGAVMEVSPFERNYLISGRNGPQCEYSLRYGSLNGPPAQNARIGDKVYHEWRCADSGFAFKVYDCFVHDGANKKYMLIDDNGCSKDKTIVPDLTYDPNLNFAFAASRVFKFAESTKMFFNCLLYMCPKNDPACQKVVPPRCGSRSKRSVSTNANNWFTVNATLPIRAALSLERESDSDYGTNDVRTHFLDDPDNQIMQLEQSIAHVPPNGISILDPNDLNDVQSNSLLVMSDNNNINMTPLTDADTWNSAATPSERLPKFSTVSSVDMGNVAQPADQPVAPPIVLLKQSADDESVVDQVTEKPDQMDELVDEKALYFPTSHSHLDCQPVRNQFRTALLALLTFNFVSLSVAILALASLCRRRHSARLDLMCGRY